MREEYQAYQAIVEAGFVLQLDDPGLPNTWGMAQSRASVEEYKKFATVRVEALNHALRGLPEDRIRYRILLGQLAWAAHYRPAARQYRRCPHAGSRRGVLGRGGQCPTRARVEGLAGRQIARCKILIPVVVSRATNVVEHPELLADRILTFAKVVGRENVIVGTDCGLGGRIHPQLAWAKLEALVAGTRLASNDLWPS
jgi:5-methyltetrahydropteroyltriglutamate--homocysteine methyltransferase